MSCTPEPPVTVAEYALHSCSMRATLAPHPAHHLPGTGSSIDREELVREVLSPFLGEDIVVGMFDSTAGCSRC